MSERVIEIVQVRLGDHHIVRAQGVTFLPPKQVSFEKAQVEAERLKSRLERFGIKCNVVCTLMPHLEQELNRVCQSERTNVPYRAESQPYGF